MAHPPGCLSFWGSSADDLITAFTQLHAGQGRGWARRLPQHLQWVQVKGLYEALRTALGEPVNPIPGWLGGRVQPNPKMFQDIADVIVGLNTDSLDSPPHLPGAMDGWLLLSYNGGTLPFGPEAEKATALFLLSKDALDM